MQGRRDHAKGQSPSWDGYWHGCPHLSQQLPWETDPADRSHSHGPRPGLPGQCELLPSPRARLLGSHPTPYLRVHRGHSCELHAEHTLMAIHPAHARKCHLWEGKMGWALAGPPLPIGLQAQPLRHCGLSMALPGGTAGHHASDPAQRRG